jgi:hypothetical protein
VSEGRDGRKSSGGKCPQVLKGAVGRTWGHPYGPIQPMRIGVKHMC